MKYLLIILIFTFNLIQNYSQLKETNNQQIVNREFGKTIQTEKYLNEGNNSAGFTVGYSFRLKLINFGLNYEHFFSQSKIGLPGIGISVRYNTASEEILNNSAKLRTTNISGGVQLNYHFNTLKAQELIPFGGIVLGYNNAGTTYKFNSGIKPAGYDDIHKGQIFIFGQAGLRYFFSRKAAVILILGTGNTYKTAVELGFDFKFNN
ncbi:MAG: hypothetical protein IT280_11000 [Ignavibacteria bacterium]|nr:hypothetical protein [Ignavibacteria bacterium]